MVPGSRMTMPIGHCCCCHTRRSNGPSILHSTRVLEPDGTLNARCLRLPIARRSVNYSRIMRLGLLHHCARLLNNPRHGLVRSTRDPYINHASHTMTTFLRGASASMHDASSEVACGINAGAFFRQLNHTIVNSAECSHPTVSKMLVRSQVSLLSRS